MRHVYVTAWCDQAHVTRKLEGADGLMAYWVDGPTFSLSQVSSNVFTPVRRESKKERSFSTSSCHSFSCTFSDVKKKEKNEKRRGKKKWREMFPERVARIDVFVPFRLYEYISVAFVVSVLYVSSPLFPLVVSGPW